MRASLSQKSTGKTTKGLLLLLLHTGTGAGTYQRLANKDSPTKRTKLLVMAPQMLLLASIQEVALGPASSSHSEQAAAFSSTKGAVIIMKSRNVGQHETPQRHDFSELGRQLIANLAATKGDLRASRAPMNAVWKEPSGATIFVGNDTAARGPASKLTEAGITHVVNCTGACILLLTMCARSGTRLTSPSLAVHADDLKNYCSGAGAQKYLRFNVASWKAAGAVDYLRERPEAEVIAHIEKMLSWVDDALASGGNVLVHCLAGAHRAGTTGILCLMHKSGLGAHEATVVAQHARPIIQPIFDFEECLQVFEAARNRKANAAAAASSSEPCT